MVNKKKKMHKSFHLNKCPTDYLNVQLEMFKYAIVTLFSGLSFPVKISPYVGKIYSVHWRSNILIELLNLKLYLIYLSLNEIWR